MSKKIFVRNLNRNISDEDLYTVFRKFGDLNEIDIVIDQETGRPSGFAFITYNDNLEAECALSELNGTEIKGNYLEITEAISS